MLTISEVLGEDMIEWAERADLFEVESLEIYGEPTQTLIEVDQPMVDSGAVKGASVPCWSLDSHEAESS